MPQRLRLTLPLFIALLVGCWGGHAVPDFTLQDDEAHQWTLSAQRGKIVLLTFGYTHCADTCPATLAKLARLTRSLPSGAAEVVFATVDPNRDTVAVLHRYVARFRQGGTTPVIGLTGTHQQIATLEGSYHVWTQRIGGKAYTEAHGTAIFLIDRNGHLAAVHDADDSDAQLLNAVSALLT